MRRQKKKPDTVQLNFVETVPGKRRSVAIKRVNYPVTAASSSPTPVSSASLFNPRDDDSFSDALSPPPFSELSGPSTSLVEPQPDSYTRRKEKSAEAWGEIRSTFVPTSVWTLGFPLSSTCIFCNCADACVRCSDCGPNAYLCGECTTKLHKDINHSHCPMLWKESEKMYVPFPKQISTTLSCDCATAYTRDVTCVDVMVASTQCVFHFVGVRPKLKFCFSFTFSQPLQSDRSWHSLIAFSTGLRL